MQSSKRPSPALVVSFIALLVALSGTAVAAKVLITSSAQIKNGTIRGADLKKGTITKKQIASSVFDSVTGSSTSASAGAAGTALEARRKYGPELSGQTGGEAKVVELQLPAGAWAIFAKTTLSAIVPDRGLLYDVLAEGQTVAGECKLDVGGSGDFGIEPIATQGSVHPATINVQATRTLGAPTTATFTCKVDKSDWRAENTSIIAVPVGAIGLTEQ